MGYKPETVEENLANITYMKNYFQLLIDSYIHQYNCLFSIFSNPFNYNQAVIYGFINNTTNFEIEVSKLAYSIFGFTNDVYHRISYALDCWYRNSNKNSSGVSFKMYDQNLSRLKDKGYITGKEKETLLRFRTGRNETTHYGKIIFINYIFNNRFEVLKLLTISEMLLESVVDIDDLKYQRYMNRQFDFLKELENTLMSYHDDIMDVS